MKQGDMGDSFYVVLTGSASVHVKTDVSEIAHRIGSGIGATAVDVSLGGLADVDLESKQGLDDGIARGGRDGGEGSAAAGHG